MFYSGLGQRNGFHAPLDIASPSVAPMVRSRLDTVSAVQGENIFLKIDAEGHDLEVFKGASGLLDKIRYVLLEVAPTPQAHGAFFCVQEAAKTNRMNEKPPAPLWLAGIYCVTFAGPLWHTVRGLVRDRDARWLWHVPPSLGGVVGDAWGVWTYKRRGRDEKLIAKLKPKQDLKQDGKS
jgi:hypothetical protein